MPLFKSTASETTGGECKGLPVTGHSVYSWFDSPVIIVPSHKSPLLNLGKAEIIQYLIHPKVWRLGLYPTTHNHGLEKRVGLSSSWGEKLSVTQNKFTWY